MKYCSHCGQQLDDETMFCPNCGTPCNPSDSVTPSVSATNNSMPSDVRKKNSSGETLRLVAFIFCLISTVGCGIALIPLLWMVPLTISVYRGYKGTKPISLGVKICVLLFVSLFAGIFLLIDNDNN